MAEARKDKIEPWITTNELFNILGKQEISEKECEEAIDYPIMSHQLFEMKKTVLWPRIDGVRLIIDQEWVAMEAIEEHWIYKRDYVLSSRKNELKICFIVAAIWFIFRIIFQPIHG